jgi:hypothetical protein
LDLWHGRGHYLVVSKVIEFDHPNQVFSPGI